MPALSVVDLPRGGTDALVEDRDAGGGPPRVPENLEDRERPPEQRLEAGCLLQHHELAGQGRSRDLGRVEQKHTVVRRQPAVVEHLSGDIERHAGGVEYINRAFTAPGRMIVPCATCACCSTR